MLIQLQPNIQQVEKDEVEAQLRKRGFRVHATKTQSQAYFVAVGGINTDLRTIGNIKAVAAVYNVPDTYPLVSSTWHPKASIIDLGDGVIIGGSRLSIIAGPCAIENEEQVRLVIAHLIENDVKIVRGGVFKPRSSPYSFRGLGMSGLRMFAQHCQVAGIKIITEVMGVTYLEEMLPYVDIFQVGARNQHNYELLDALGAIDKPVLIKRGIAGTVEELLQAAEYVFSRGNEKILLCERGIRTYETAYRNTLDLNAVAFLQEKTHLPIIVDPSHGVGSRKYVPSMALAGIASGADGILLEVHPTPEISASDAPQALHFKEAAALYPLLYEAYALHEKLKK